MTDLDELMKDDLLNRGGWWIYDDDKNHHEVGLIEYSKWNTEKMMQGIDWRRVAATTFDIDDKEIFISTVFLGIDHSWNDEGPVLYETMIFGGKHNDYQRRYKTWKEAEEGHQVAVDLVKGFIGEEDI